MDTWNPNCEETNKGQTLFWVLPEKTKKICQRRWREKDDKVEKEEKNWISNKKLELTSCEFLYTNPTSLLWPLSASLINTVSCTCVIFLESQIMMMLQSDIHCMSTDVTLYETVQIWGDLPVDVITRGQSTTIFLNITPFLPWWQPHNQVILVLI